MMECTSMSQAPITIIINNNTYTLSATNIESLRGIPDADRQQLIALLEVMKQQERTLQPPHQQATTRANTSVVKPTSLPTTRPERLGSGDVDNIMAQLIMEERANQKPEITTQTIYKWAAIAAIVIIFLAAVFS